jgi:heat shock protein HspQ
LKVVVADVDPSATAKVMPVSSELEKDTPLGNAPYVHVIVPVYNAV